MGIFAGVVLGFSIIILGVIVSRLKRKSRVSAQSDTASST